MRGEIHLYPDREPLMRAFAEAFVTAAQKNGIGEVFSVALAGGNTPRPFYEILGRDFRDRVPWSRVHLFWADERYVPPDDPESNYRLVKETLLDAVFIPPENVHPAPTDLDDPDQAARAYEDDLKTALARTAGKALDWVILGLGEDGHLASLFPGSSALKERRRFILAVTDSPKPPLVRLTMTLPLINGARAVHFLVSGGSKSRALELSLEDPSSQRLPAHDVRPSHGSLHWWVDAEAAPFLTNK